MDDRRARAEAIEDFAEVLRELRRSVGDPPFREMSGRSGAISHTTLHEATKGNRLPSWETTVEFVRACGADPADYRERWEKANQTVRGTGIGDPPVLADASVDHPPGAVATSAAGAAGPRTAHTAMTPQASGPAAETPASVSASRPGESTGGIRPVLPAPGGRGRFRRTLPTVLTAVAAAAGVGAAVLIVTVADRVSGPAEPGPSLSGGPPPSPAGCPVQQANPAWAPPVHKGDAAEFVADVTLPDCTRVGAGETMPKVWRLKNAGTVPWKGYSLRRLDPPQRTGRCRTASAVPIGETRPGETVDVRIDITTPREPGLCYVRFKMMDASGKIAFPGSRPINFQIIVDAP
ncbi:NBR1-Ig-like domain-containing protein [Planomonospora corallina]|uniref:NBR1-Ig-like domain-containing protein n=1 Tax=Planomonospora corallina TaxID=1806052 RepID=A0ABV8IFX4_9ACTN